MFVAGTNKAKKTALLNHVYTSSQGVPTTTNVPTLAWQQPWVLPTDEEFLQLLQAGVAGLRCGLASMEAAREGLLEASLQMLR